MRIVTTRRISQVFFLALLCWLCFVATLGAKFWQLSGWPVNWLLQLDPLVALGTVLATGTLFAGLIWSLVTIVLTLIFGRVFCGWVCPFGSLHQFFGWLGRRNKPLPARLDANRYRRPQVVKYYILIFLLAAAMGGVLRLAAAAAGDWPLQLGLIAIGLIVAIALLGAVKIIANTRKLLLWVTIMVGLVIVAATVPGINNFLGASLQTGLLDPIPLIYRTVNLVLLPLGDSTVGLISPVPRLYEWGWVIGGVFLVAIGLNFVVPRFYCRFVCPLGALLGVLDRWAIWRIGKPNHHCTDCGLCESDCEGACEPDTQIRISECVLCMNCIDGCPKDTITYQRRKSVAGEVTNPDISRRGIIAALLSGLAAPAVFRLGGGLAESWNHKLIRPPGALDEERFLTRCIKCGQCMRICPTNVIQPAGFEGGIEGFLTPRLNNRIGTSGCQFNCVACSLICPTAAIRPLAMEEKMGFGDFAEAGPLKIGTAFVDRGRCLPWSFDRPCIVCQENCPVSPKAIFVRTEYQPVRGGAQKLSMIQGYLLEFAGEPFKESELATGDYFCRIGSQRKRIVENAVSSISLSPGDEWDTLPQIGDEVVIEVYLQRPYVDPELCIGCGVCEHECPVSGKRAIRVSAEGESRSKDRSLLA